VDILLGEYIDILSLFIYMPKQYNNRLLIREHTIKHCIA